MKPKGKIPSALAKSSSKGKVGKKKSGVSGSNSASVVSPSVSELPEFLDVAPFDHVRHCPRYCVLVDRDAESDPATSDELDPVQLELEQILLHNMKRQGSITNQLSALTDGEVPSTSEMQAESGQSRSTPTPLILRRLLSDLLTTTSSSRSGTPPAAIRAASPKVKVRLPNANAHRRPKPISAEETEDAGDSAPGNSMYAPIPILDARGRRRTYFWPQNHMPDKFWQFVSEHCDDIEKDDLAAIRELLQENSADKTSKFFRCPGLGKHYSLRWNQEDAAATKKNAESKGGKGGKKRKLNSPDPASGGDSGSDLDRKFAKLGSLERRSGVKTKQQRSSTDGVTKNGTHAGTIDHYCLGPLTERLVQALVEEGSITEEHGGSWLGDFGEVKDFPDMNGVNSPNKALVKSLNLGNMAALEKRIQKELEDQGLLDGDEDSDSDEPTSSKQKQEDEVTEELRKRQEELRSVTEGNRNRLEQVLDHMEVSQVRQEQESQLQQVDKEVLELYGRFYSLVPKRKPSSKKERDQLWKALKDRMKLIKKLDSA